MSGHYDSAAAGSFPPDAGNFPSNEAAVFSGEEQREIARRIEAASARGSVAPPGPPARGEASRRGLFPLLVNAAALLILAAGLFCFSALHRTEAVEIRESGAVLGITERALIQEIRRETNQKLFQKEEAIEAMNFQIAGVEAELERLDSLEALSDEQRETMAALRLRQEEYRAGLEALQSERAQILAEAVRRETALHTRLEEQREAIENLSEQSRSEIGTAREELAKLSSEQEKAALIERQLNGYFAAVEKFVQAGHYREAMETIAGLREFLNTPAFQTIARFQARRESDLAAANVLSLIVSEALKAGGAAAVGAAISASPNAAEPVPASPANAAVLGNTAPAAAGNAAAGEAALRRQLAERETALAAREQSIRELERNAGELQASAIAARLTVQERDRQIEALRAQNTAYAQTISTQQNTIERITTELERR
jgi:hypothetical protein